LNVSHCFATDEGSGLSLPGYNSALNASFVNFDQCLGKSLIWNYASFPEPEFSNCNFVGNNLTTGLFDSFSYGSVVRRCIFVRNAGRLISVFTGRWGGTLIVRYKFAECVFDGVPPTASVNLVSVSANSRATTATYAVRVIDTAACPAASATLVRSTDRVLTTGTGRGRSETLQATDAQSRTITLGRSVSESTDGSGDSGGGGNVPPGPTPAPPDWLVLGLGVGIPAAIVIIAVVAIVCICVREKREKQAAETPLASVTTTQKGTYTADDNIH
jgi:hypothetical protein